MAFTTAPSPMQPGYIADPRTKAQIAAMSGARQAPATTSNDWLAQLIALSEAGGASGGSVADGGPGAAYGNQAGAPAITAQDRVNARAQALADARLRNQTQPQTNLADLFGVGGGDWASQWGKQADPRSRINSNFYQGLGLDTDIFNSPTGPYGQLQMAAAYSAPARNDRQARMYEADTAKEIARMKTGTANRVLSNLANLMSNPNQMNGFETDYGASAMLKPTNLRRFF